MVLTLNNPILLTAYVIIDIRECTQEPQNFCDGLKMLTIYLISSNKISSF